MVPTLAWGDTLKRQNPDITPGTDNSNDWFGLSAAVDGDTILIGAIFESSGGNDRNGAAYVFTRDGDGEWSEQAKLVAGDAQDDGLFGKSVALHGETAIVGSPGAQAAYVFVRDDMGAWSQQAKLAVGGSSSFGESVDLAEGVALIGAGTVDEDDITNTGALYVYRRNNLGVWYEHSKLVTSDAEKWDEIGYSVGMSGLVVMTGSIGNDGAGKAAGAAYVFHINVLP